MSEQIIPLVQSSPILQIRNTLEMAHIREESESRSEVLPKKNGMVMGTVRW